jgi:uncharacterized protein (TIGR03435 family)
MLVTALTELSQLTPAPVRFDVASIKGGAIDTSRINVVIKAGRVNYRAHTLQELVRRAYGVRADQVSGPNWTETERYDVVATMAPDTPREHIPLMVQTLLAERFKLVLQRDTKSVQTWVLVTASGGPRLKPVDGDPDTIRAYAGHADSGINGKGPLSTLAYYLTKFVRDPVVDLTGLKGSFEINLKWPAVAAEPEQAPAGAPAPAVPYLMKQLSTLGVKLERRKVPTEYLTITSAQKEPVEN